MEITDDKILKVALITTLIGIIGLIICTPTIEVKEVKIEELNKGMIDEELAITGVVEEIKPSASGSTYFLKVNDGTGIITIAACYLANQRTINLLIAEYNSKLELILSNSNSISIIN